MLPYETVTFCLADGLGKEDKCFFAITFNLNVPMGSTSGVRLVLTSILCSVMKSTAMVDRKYEDDGNRKKTKVWGK